MQQCVFFKIRIFRCYIETFYCAFECIVFILSELLSSLLLFLSPLLRLFLQAVSWSSCKDVAFACVTFLSAIKVH